MYQPHYFYYSGVTPAFTPELIAVWEVSCGDHAYTRSAFDKTFYPQEMLSLVRCPQGDGVMETCHGTLPLPEGTLLLIPAREIVSFTSVTPIWKYHWYNFIAPQTPPFFTQGHCYTIPVDEAEHQNLERMFLYQGMGESTANAVLTSLFTLQYFIWAHRAVHQAHEQSASYAQINAALQTMHAHLGEPLQMEALARSVGMSGRYFRAQFIKLYGMPPKAYQQHIRLQRGADRLRASTDTISEIADQLGYSSPFHFSRAFKQAYGISPSAFRAARQNKPK